MNILTLKQSLNKAYFKQRIQKGKFDQFKNELTQLVNATNEKEHEEFNKNLLADFLKHSFYSPNHSINTKDRNDLVIHNGADAKSLVGVLIETKKPNNKSEMLSKSNVNVKAFHELILYFLRERITNGNKEVKHLIATNNYEWFVFDAALFERLFAENKTFVKEFSDFEEKRLSGTKTDFFYKEIAAPFVKKIKSEIEFTYFDLRNYEKALKQQEDKPQRKLVELYKIFSPEHLLKLPFSNDSNSLDKKFYTELLHIMGLAEKKDKGKKLIGRKDEKDRDGGSIIENTIVRLEGHDVLNRIDNPIRFGNSHEERLFNLALELCIIWINRILFLKLLEGQLLGYHNGNKEYRFLNAERIKNYDDLDSLFFQVLARQPKDRGQETQKAFAKVPYLNSSLFETTDLEHSTVFISNLKDDKELSFLSSTVLKNDNGKRRTGKMNGLHYLFSFLDAYDFGSENADVIREDNKSLINASVLGLIFEKINGYKDGSFFTPGFITMYMCRETIRKAVLQKFEETKGWKCKSIDELYDKIEDSKEANTIINSLKVCDPAVGSGHFLVSALNEIIAIKHELKILQDRNGKRLKEYEFEVANDELIVTDEEGELFEYHYKNKESLRVQEALFHEKETIIENCLFGVDINPNSVKICRLRLWIELLKNAYYKNESELETLPNIDINIKTGNSLISRFALDADIKKALKKSKWSIDSYQLAVSTYRNAEDKTQKREMEKLIADIKTDFRSEIQFNDKKMVRLRKVQGELTVLATQTSMFDKSKTETKAYNKKVDKLATEAKKLETEIEEIKNNKIYENAFEWRFEFPEVLNDDGDFMGFDVVIGNPPYFSLSKIKEIGNYFESNNFQTYEKTGDIYCVFIEKGGRILKENGLLTYITSNSWIRAKYGNSLKIFITNGYQPINLVNIEDFQVFEEATVESNILTIQKKSYNGKIDICILDKSFNQSQNLSNYVTDNSFEYSTPDTINWFINRKPLVQLKTKIEKDTLDLGKRDISINFGIKTGYNNAFIINEEDRNMLVKADRKNSRIIKPILRGRDLRKYSLEFAAMYLINSHNGLKEEGINAIKLETEYPTLYKQLIKHSPKVEARYDQGHHWSNLRNCAYLKDFAKPKIVWGEISDKPKFAYDDEGYYAEATAFIMVGSHLKFLLGILNSKLSEWYFNQIGTTTGMGTNRWKKYKIEQLPIKNSSDNQRSFIELKVNEILALKKENPNADTSILENEIDQLVYELYDLNEEEIAIVENGNK